ncbi:hypothetical protein [Photorhabdus cinerea]|uniref:Uncharacterized protein n=1 Tax=Photorhabdus cinerea TaxID=471575 RepID=A0A7X5QCD4_9GAMM|nr:hypothetical protein [Photorhabdus cinerea]NHB91753.1 hypothetical protein [Photorhabdus cinerea]
MAPDLNDSYIKDLSRKPDCIKEEIVEKFYHLSKGNRLLMQVGKKIYSEFVSAQLFSSTKFAIQKKLNIFAGMGRALRLFIVMSHD